MSMDDVLRALQMFSDDLKSFTSTISDAAVALDKEHESLAEIWNDPFSEEYRREWRGFESHLERYLRDDAPWYRDFLEEKIERIGRYLYG